MAKSDNGWQVSADKDSIEVKNYIVEGTTIHFAVARGAAPLLLAFAKWYNEHIEPIAGKTYDDWGYAYRAVRGQTTGFSNHASGSAIDINSQKYPLSKKVMKPEKVKLIRQECDRLGLKWGGDFSRIDEMHYEVALNPAAAAQLIDELNLPMPKIKGAKK